MTDVFLSYSSIDRERVRKVYDALIAEGFDVFWDQEVPPGRNWDSWIRQHLEAAKCTVVFWSKHSVVSDNVVHEATMAKNAGRLLPVLLCYLKPQQFPMGHYTLQAVPLVTEENFLQNLPSIIAQIEAKATRRWMRRKLGDLESKLSFSAAIREELEDANVALRRKNKDLEKRLAKARKDQVNLRNLIDASDAEIEFTENASPDAAKSSIVRYIQDSMIKVSAVNAYIRLPDYPLDAGMTICYALGYGEKSHVRENVSPRILCPLS